MIQGRMLDTTARGEPGARVLLAMSGGVDSAASAVLLRRAGLDVVAVTMRNYCYSDGEVPERSCCSLGAIDDARSVCARLDIAHMVADTEESFGRAVYDDFVSEYRHARTPNPCVRCNSIVRFRTLRELAARVGARYVATGHYARVFRSDSGRCYVARARHLEKDQSYFLSGLGSEGLDDVLFPLGGLRKTQVRETARDAGLAVAEKAESQEVCFVPDGSLRDFLRDKIPLAPGDIEDTRGTVLGRHEGLGVYTVGQRRGIGLATGRPRYVVRLDRERNVLVVGGEEDLLERRLVCRLGWIDEDVLDCGGVTARIRSRGPFAPVAGLSVDGATTAVEFAEPQRAIAPGQTIAFYCGDVVVGAGVIDSVGGGS